MENDQLPPLKPLRGIDFGTVMPKLSGLKFNLDRELQRRNEQANARGDMEADRCLSLLNIILRFAWNSFETVIYIAGDIPEDMRRKPNFVLVVPNINRQLLDLLFSLAYMLEDLVPRSLAYQRSGWRELYEEIATFKENFSDDPEWQAFFRSGEQALDSMATRYRVTEEEQKNPKLIRYWQTPYQLIKRIEKEKIACGDFLKYLERWLYRDTSAQSHMSHGGLFKIALFLVADIIGEDAKKTVNDRPMKMYHFQQISRTTLSFLAIATEIDTYCKFGNRDTIDYLWSLLTDYFPEGKEMWEVRYQNRAH